MAGLERLDPGDVDGAVTEFNTATRLGAYLALAHLQRGIPRLKQGDYATTRPAWRTLQGAPGSIRT